MTKREAVDMLIPEDMQSKIDYALPQSWVDDMVKLTDSFNVCGNYVWIYDKSGGIFGRPFPLTIEGCENLSRYNLSTGCQYPTGFEIE
jgi:hypothetical protein